jgi:hypothetical protein
MLTPRIMTGLKPALAAAAGAALLLAGGCATGGGQTTREARFIDMDSNVLQVAYSEEKRSEILPNGLACTFSGKVRVRLPDGKRVTLYQTLSSSGMRYLSSNKRYELREMGIYCYLLKDNKRVFEGVYCRAK